MHMLGSKRFGVAGQQGGATPKRFDSRGQESAPFELLVAVIVMTFVILIGTTAILTLNREKCKGEIQAELDKFTVAIERVAAAKGAQPLNFSPPQCFDEKNTVIKISEETSADICAVYCGGGTDFCMLLKYVSGTEFVSWNCLKISPLTAFLTGDSCDDDLAEGYEPVNLRAPAGGTIEPGHYVLVGKFDALSAFPMVCAYRRR